MFLLIILASALSDSFEEKEETCFYLISSAQKLRFTEVENHLQANPGLDKRKLFLKLSEDSLEHCLANISPEEQKIIGLRRIRDFHPYSHLYMVDLNKYTANSDLGSTENYLERRMRITKRITKDINRPNDL